MKIRRIDRIESECKMSSRAVVECVSKLSSCLLSSSILRSGELPFVIDRKQSLSAPVHQAMAALRTNQTNIQIRVRCMKVFSEQRRNGAFSIIRLGRWVRAQKAKGWPQGCVDSSRPGGSRGDESSCGGAGLVGCRAVDGAPVGWPDNHQVQDGQGCGGSCADEDEDEA